MPTWTLRLIACAGFVALLSRLPALDTTADAVALGAGGAALAVVAHFGPLMLRALYERHVHGRVSPSLRPSTLQPRLPSAHGADA